jgi:hypothetical protein
VEPPTSRASTPRLRSCGVSSTSYSRTGTPFS